MLSTLLAIKVLKSQRINWHLFVVPRKKQFCFAEGNPDYFSSNPTRPFPAYSSPFINIVPNHAVLSDRSPQWDCRSAGRIAWQLRIAFIQFFFLSHSRPAGLLYRLVWLVSHRDLSGTRWLGDSLSTGAPSIWAFPTSGVLFTRFQSLSKGIYCILSRPPASVYRFMLLQVAEQAWEFS